MIVGFHASHEQFPPSRLLRLAVEAEAAGFEAIMCSDHFAPWSHRQGHSGFAWSWLGAAMQATSLPFGVVTAPVQRYHPAVIAQAIATLGELFPGRFWAALGSGENLNESITGDRWPKKPVRDRRLREAATAIKELLAGDTVDREGLVRLHEARLYTLPAAPAPRLFGAALTPQTAGLVAAWAGGLITVNLPEREQVAEVIGAYREAGGLGPVYLQAHLSWAGSREEALRNAEDQWISNTLPAALAEDLPSPDEFEAWTKGTPAEALSASVHISPDLDDQAAWLAAWEELGVDAVFAHNVGLNQREFVLAFGRRVLPRLRRRPAA